MIASLLSAAPASADCPVPEGASDALAERSPAERMHFLLESVRHGEEVTRTWTNVFSLGYLGLATVQMAIIGAADPGTRIDLGIGAAGSMIGVASLALFRSPVLADRATLEALAAEAVEGDCEALARAEQLIDASAESEAFGTSWLIHVGTVVFNLGIGLLMGLGYGRWVSGVISASVGIAVGELQVLTRPTPMLQARRRYLNGELGESGPEVRLVPVVSPTEVALGVSGRF